MTRVGDFGYTDPESVDLPQAPIPGQGVPEVPAVRSVRDPMQPYYLEGFQDSNVPLRFELDERTRHIIIFNTQGSQEDLLFAWQQPDTIGGVLRPGQEVTFDEVTIKSPVLFLALDPRTSHGFGFFYQVWGW
jgi:hypothetical protein